MNFKTFYHPLIFISIFILAAPNASGISFEQDVSLTTQQKKLLDQLKERVIDQLPNEYMKKEINLIKWLRSSKFDVDVAESRMLRDVQWRKDRKMDTIHTEDWSDIEGQDYRYFLDGRDKLGRSFLYFEVKNLDNRKLILQGKGERLLRYVEKGYDAGCSLIRELGEKYGNMTRGHLLVNLDGYNPIQHACLRCLPFLIRMMFGYLEHYPECVDHIICVNSPSAIKTLVDIARPWIDDDLANSVFIYGTNKQKWMAELSKDFDFDQLPPALGGTKIYKGMEEHE
ncbi:SEC14 cytosolic factor [Folsomia candida]|uniref:CRAL-TRIO domain-containing protein n=1 Tax=Folsomia candida TaxID=158441 RepID=A0A226EL38_FOLCA|nr:SEC14 cytosolic factor [Folsomia candida]OXA58010.1 hypothetical protein Fcan01_06927 [Folsomia candida]